ncbi:adenylate/guanylate cyclase domain-containing protein [Acidobacteriota bacterium]
MEHKLEYIFNDELKTFYLKKDTISVGKLASNDLQINESAVSRSHCTFSKTGKIYKLTDLGSTNGTYINGRRITEKELKVGDNIIIGRTMLNYLQVTEAESINDVGDQKISMIVPLSDEFKIEKKKKIEPTDLTLLTSLTALGKDLIASTSLESSFEKVANLIFEYLNPKRVFIFSSDEKQEDLILKHSRTKKGKEEGKVNISKTIAMKAIKEKVAILSSNTRDDSRFDGAKSIIIFGITSAISVPIWTKNSIYGLVYIDTTAFDQMFKEEDLEILSIIANFTGLSIEGIESLKKLNREKKVRAKLERYHSPSVVSRIMGMQDQGSQEVIAYKETVATVFFMDIVGFTTKVEHLSPVETGVFLNNFFTEMTDIIFKHNGTLDKYIGDAIMAVFGVPFEIGNHAESAIQAALDMMGKLKEMNRSQPQKDRIQIRIGINAGKLISGDFGSPKRLDYTVIGNTVNVASRLESSVAGANDIVISEAVHKLAANVFEYEYLGGKKLQGILTSVKTYKVKKRLRV